MEKDYSKYLEDFCNSSVSFTGFMFKGSYNMPYKHFFKLFNHYIVTGENLLDSYSDIIYLSWSKNSNFFYYSEDEINKKESSLNHSIFLELFNESTIEDIKENIQSYRNKEVYISPKKKNYKRAKASEYTAKKNIRELVFKLYGDKCLSCGSEHNITLDHVISVKNGGKNEIDNLQPLCNSCNSRKGVKTIDFRKNKL